MKNLNPNLKKLRIEKKKKQDELSPGDYATISAI